MGVAVKGKAMGAASKTLNGTAREVVVDGALLLDFGSAVPTVLAPELEEEWLTGTFILPPLPSFPPPSSSSSDSWKEALPSRGLQALDAVEGDKVLLLSKTLRFKGATVIEDKLVEAVAAKLSLLIESGFIEEAEVAEAETGAVL